MERRGVVGLIVYTSRPEHSQPQKCSLCCLLDPLQACVSPPGRPATADHKNAASDSCLITSNLRFLQALLFTVGHKKKERKKLYICCFLKPSRPTSKVVFPLQVVPLKTTTKMMLVILVWHPLPPSLSLSRVLCLPTTNESWDFGADTGRHWDDWTPSNGFVNTRK